MHLRNKNISIVGGGLVGSLLSIFLSQQGAKVSVFDKRSDIRLNKVAAGRSINLALSNRGRKALRMLDLEDDILDISVPMSKRIMHSHEGVLTEQPYGQIGQSIYSVSRRELNIKLLNIAESNSVKIFFNQDCHSVNTNKTTLKFNNGQTIKSDFIFGTDGAGSILRKNMSNNNTDFHVVENFINSSYKELTISANNDRSYKLDHDGLHIWPRKSFMVIALPNLDGTFTCTLFAPNKGENSFSSIKDEDSVNKFFRKEFQDLYELIPDLSKQYITNPTSKLGFVRCSSWKQNNTILLGDSCHATVPFYGQGMNSGFEDCYLLNKWLNNYKSLYDKNLNQFLHNRIIDTTAMQDLSMDNYIEMRDKTADLNFLLQKKIETWFSEKHPDKWQPLYSMVTFSDMRYSLAIKKGKLQDKIMKQIMIDNNLFQSFDIKELIKKNIEQKILSKLSV